MMWMVWPAAQSQITAESRAHGMLVNTITANGQTPGATLRGVRPEDLTSRDIVTQGTAPGELGAFDLRPGQVMRLLPRPRLHRRFGHPTTVAPHNPAHGAPVATSYPQAVGVGHPGGG